MTRSSIHLLLQLAAPEPRVGEKRPPVGAGRALPGSSPRAAATLLSIFRRSRRDLFTRPSPLSARIARTEGEREAPAPQNIKRRGGAGAVRTFAPDKGMHERCAMEVET